MAVTESVVPDVNWINSVETELNRKSMKIVTTETQETETIVRRPAESLELTDFI
jgi:hypothetical protein